MSKLALLKFILLLTIVQTAYGQKAKYKDIFALLSTKQFESAEPFLKGYLKETTDNPNAYLYMGMIFQEKALKDDVLKQTRRMLARMDSAIIYYDKAYKSVTDREIKKNGEYYQAYNRRDLRTGEFGVKLSDVQFDLEKRMEGIRERKDRVKMVKYYFSMTDSLYKKANSLYVGLQNQFPGQKEFYLRADEETLKNLAALVTRFDSCVKVFDQYKGSIASIGKTGYNQTMSLQEISDFKKDGTIAADFYADDIKAWDYGKFASLAKRQIETDILPTREHLVSYDIEINKLREKLSHESISVKNDLTSLIDKLLMEQLKKYDKEPLPMEVFALKIAELEYRSTVIENKHRPDSSDLHTRVTMLTQEVKYLTKLDSIASKLTAEDLDSRSLDYDFFVKNTFANSMALKSFIRGLKEYAEKESKAKTQALLLGNESLKWVIDGADSIPLFNQQGRSKYKPLMIVDEKYTAGLHYSDSLSPSGYLYTINTSRSPDVKVKFPVEKVNFKQSLLGSAKSLTFTDPAGHLFFVLIYSERLNKDNKVPATLAKIYKSDGLSWSMNYQLAFMPTEIEFKSETGELLIKGADNQQHTMDKNGKLLK